MLLQRVRLVLLFSVVCHLTRAFPTQMPSAYDDIPSLQVNISHPGVLFAPLGRSVVIPCLASSTPRMLPRVKWTLLSGGQETQILVARGDRVKVNEAYLGRVALLNDSSSPGDVSLRISNLRSSDSGHYRCEVQQGLEDASDLVQLKVKGVVFHYRDATDRYFLSFHQAKAACKAIGAQIANGSQLWAAYFDGYEQCDAGWIEDQTVRYPIQNPREACYGDMDGQPGVRSYGLMNAEDRYDVYCYVEQMDGEVFHDPMPQQLSFEGAQSYCRAAGAQMASTAQLYMAWSEGLDHCSPGWLSDGSVRYPIRTPRERCGGPLAGVKTIYRFSNQTVFPEPSRLFDVFCFKGTDDAKDSTVDSTTDEPRSLEQDVVILKAEESVLLLGQNSEQVEREAQSVLETIPLYPPAKENDINEHTFLSDNSENPLSTTVTSDFLGPLDRTSSSTETYDYDSQSTTGLIKGTTQSTDSYQNFTEVENTTWLPKFNGTYLHNLPEPDSMAKGRTPPLNKGKEQLETNLYFNSTETQDEILQAPPSTQTVKQVEKREPASQTTEPPADLTSFWIPMSGSGDTSQESRQEVTVFKLISKSTTHQTPPVSTGSASPKSFTSVAVPTFPSRSGHSHTLGSDNLLKSIYTLTEGSTSSEIEDTLDSVERQLLPTKAIPFEATSSTTQYQEKPTESITALYQPSGHRALFDVSTTSYEETSGLEPDMITAQTSDHITFNSTVKEKVVEDATGATAIEEVKVVHMFAQNFRPNKAFGKEEEKHRNAAGNSKEVTTMFDEEANVTRNPSGSIASMKLKESDATVYQKEVAATTTPIFEVETKAMLNPKEGTESTPKLEEIFNDSLTHREVNVTLLFKEATATLDPKVEPTLAPTTVLPMPKERFDITPIFEEEAKAIQSLEKVAKGSQRLEEAANVINSEEVDTITPVYEEEAKTTLNLDKVGQVTLRLEEATNATTNFEEGGTIPTYEEEAEAVLNLDKVAEVTLRFEEAANASASSEEVGTTTPVYEEEAKAMLNLHRVTQRFEEEANVTPNTEEVGTLTPAHEEKATAMLNHDKVAKITLSFEEAANVAANSDAIDTTTPFYEEEVTTVPKKEAEMIPVSVHLVTPTFQEKVFTSSEVEASATPTFSEDTTEATTPDDDTSTGLAFDEEITVFPLDPKSSNWALLTTTTEPQESQKDLEISTKSSSLSSTTAPRSLSAAEATRMAAVRTTTWSPWSPTTATPKVFHWTQEPQTVTMMNVDFSPTQASTRHVLPKEKAAVGGKVGIADACVHDPCLNGGTCMERDGQIQCLCLPTYGGDLCDKDLQSCEPGWDKFHGFCYRHFGQRLSWEVAEQHCRMQGAHLVSILTPEEQDYINNNYKEYQWTGLNDKTIENDFQWSDGNPLLYENWYRGQPDSYFLSGEDCVVMVWHDDGRWSDVPCNYHLAYTCKKGTSSCGPPPRVRNASMFGKPRQRYETDAVVRYHCNQAFQQRLNPLIRCLPGGRWERPQIQCFPEHGGLDSEMTTSTDGNLAAFQDGIETTTESPLYWDIKF
ncbi:brevican core protein-like isoform X1 [Nerophis ophidion]|uniref:brevican core protein-like isoform X1 n=1 Tax=Nerophis ophidion TaxID=159077 RepID=UPI002AE07647|nr:brevican core protein-like isoform X1 [Nerophis ophidion]